MRFGRCVLLLRRVLRDLARHFRHAQVTNDLRQVSGVFLFLALGGTSNITLPLS